MTEVLSRGAGGGAGAEFEDQQQLVDKMLAQWYGEGDGDSIQKLESDIASASVAAAKEKAHNDEKRSSEVGSNDEEDVEEEEEIDEDKPLDWVPRIDGQEAALFLFAVPDNFDAVHDDWAMMYAGSYPNVEAAEAVQEELMAKDDRFTTMVCQMYDGIGRFPPSAKEYKGRIRYRSKHMQDVHDQFRTTQEEAKTILKNEADKRLLYREKDAEGKEVEDTDTEHGQMFPLPTTTITREGVKQNVIDADIIVEKGVHGASQELAAAQPQLAEQSQESEQ